MKRRIALWALLGALAIAYMVAIIVANWFCGPRAGYGVLAGAALGIIGLWAMETLGDAYGEDEPEPIDIVCPGCGARFELHMEPWAKPEEMPRRCPLCGSPLDVEKLLRRAESGEERRP